MVRSIQSSAILLIPLTRRVKHLGILIQESPSMNDKELGQDDINELLHEIIDLNQVLVLETEILKDQVKHGNSLGAADDLDSIAEHSIQSANLLLKLRKAIAHQLS